MIPGWLAGGFQENEWFLWVWDSLLFLFFAHLWDGHDNALLIGSKCELLHFGGVYLDRKTWLVLPPML